MFQSNTMSNLMSNSGSNLTQEKFLFQLNEAVFVEDIRPY